MEPDRNATEQISLFPDHVKPVFLHLRHPPHLLDEKIRAFDCSVKKKAAEAASNNRCLLILAGLEFSTVCHREFSLNEILFNSPDFIEWIQNGPGVPNDHIPRDSSL